MSRTILGEFGLILGYFRRFRGKVGEFEGKAGESNVFVWVSLLILNHQVYNNTLGHRRMLPNNGVFDMYGGGI